MAEELQAFIDGFEDGVVVIDRNHLVRQVNAAIRAQFSLGEDDVVGRPCCEVLPCHQQPCDLDDACPASGVFGTGRTERKLHPCHIKGQAAWIDIIASPLVNERGEIDRVVEIWRDITELKQLQEWYERRVRELSALHHISLTTSRSLSLQEILNHSLDQVLDVLQVEAGGIYC